VPRAPSPFVANSLPLEEVSGQLHTKVSGSSIPFRSSAKAATKT